MQGMDASLRHRFTSIGYGLVGCVIVASAQNLLPRQTKEDISCWPKKDGRIHLGQDNFPHCLECNASGRYVLVGSVNFSNFSLVNQMKYPLYNLFLLFRGGLDTGSYHISDFYLNRAGLAGLFSVISDSALFNVHFKNPYVLGTNHTAVLAAMAYGDHTMNMTTDRAVAMSKCVPPDCMFNGMGAS